MVKKNDILLIVLSAVMIGVFLVISNLGLPVTEHGTATEENLSEEEEELAQASGVPESPGYAWDDAAGAALANIMDISELKKYPVYYFSVPENAGSYSRKIARELLGSDYENAEVSSNRMNREIFPGWGDMITYQLPDDFSTELAVSLYHVSYSDNSQPENQDKEEDTDLVGLTNEYLKRFRWGFWDGTDSCSVLEEKDGKVEVSSILSGLPADKYGDRTQLQHEDGYFYNAAREKMIFSYQENHLSGLEFVFSGSLSRKEELTLKYTSIKEIMDTIKANEKENNIFEDADNPVYILFEPESIECCYIIGTHPENPEYKASPWLIVSGTENTYWFGDKKWMKDKNTHIGINLATGEVGDVFELKVL